MDRHTDTYIFNTFFHAKLSTSDLVGVQNWRRPRQLFEKRLLLFPVHLQNHWCLVVVFTTDRTICLYDSLGTSSRSFRSMEVTEKFLAMEAARFRKLDKSLPG